MIRVLATMDYYLPGFKAGGPIRTVANVVDRLGNEIDFAILTADRDLGDRQAYPEIAADSWVQVGPAHVRYLSPRAFALRNWIRLLRETPYDLLYLNSFFSPLTVRTLALRRLGLVPQRPTIVAPRGEFSPGALSIKWTKKRTYIEIARRIGLYDGVSWQASSDHELTDIVRVRSSFLDRTASFQRTPNDASVEGSIFVAPDLLPTPSRAAAQPRRKRTGNLRVVFLSRISRMKNLDFALRVLLTTPDEVDFDIYGPIEDPQMWQQCEQLMSRLPRNVRARYLGSVAAEDSIQVLSSYHVLLLPTLGENFGHVIWEALSAGCLPLISDRTPWRGLTEREIGWDLPLSEPERFATALADAVELSSPEFERHSAAARDFAWQVASDPAAVEANRQLFHGAIERARCRS